jgi:predicted amidophosphoribosyltransferase
LCPSCGHPLPDTVPVHYCTHCGEPVKRPVDHYAAMQQAGARGDMDAVERHAAALTDAEVKRLGSLEAVAGVPELERDG